MKKKIVQLLLGFKSRSLKSVHVVHCSATRATSTCSTREKYKPLSKILFQLCFKKLFSAAVERNDQSLVAQFEVVSESLKVALSIGDAKKNAVRIGSDFYLSGFDPVTCLNLENIFYDFPRLCAILASECIPLEVLNFS